MPGSYTTSRDAIDVPGALTNDAAIGSSRGGRLVAKPDGWEKRGFKGLAALPRKCSDMVASKAEKLLDSKVCGPATCWTITFIEFDEGALHGSRGQNDRRSCGCSD